MPIVCGSLFLAGEALLALGWALGEGAEPERAFAVCLRELEEACWAVGVAVQDGRGFYGNCHFRMNLALPLSRVEEALERLKKYVFI